MILSAVLAFSLFVCLSTSSHGHSDIGGMVEVDDARENKGRLFLEGVGLENGHGLWYEHSLRQAFSTVSDLKMNMPAVLSVSLFICLSTSSHAHSDIGGMVEVDETRENKCRQGVGLESGHGFWYGHLLIRVFSTAADRKMNMPAVLAVSLFVCLATSSHAHSDIEAMVEVDNTRENKGRQC